MSVGMPVPQNTSPFLPCGARGGTQVPRHGGGGEYLYVQSHLANQSFCFRSESALISRCTNGAPHEGGVLNTWGSRLSTGLLLKILITFIYLQI